MSLRPIQTLRVSSNYSISERARVRLAIISYMRAFGLGYGRMFDRMQEVLPEEYRYAVKDKSQISEFLKGSEPEDEKVRAFLKFLKLERPESVQNKPFSVVSQIYIDVSTESLSKLPPENLENCMLFSVHFRNFLQTKANIGSFTSTLDRLVGDYERILIEVQEASLNGTGTETPFRLFSRGIAVASGNDQRMIVKDVLRGEISLGAIGSQDQYDKPLKYLFLSDFPKPRSSSQEQGRIRGQSVLREYLISRVQSRKLSIELSKVGLLR